MRLALPILLLAACPAALAGPPASPLLPPDHWAVRAADRLEQLGLLDRYLPAQRSVPVAVVAAALAEGASHAPERRPDVAAEAAGWLELFRREWRLDAGTPALLGASVGGGYRWGHVDQLPRPYESRSAVLLDAPRSDPFLSGSLALAGGEHLALAGAVIGTPWRAELPAFEAVAALGRWSLSVGRARVGYGFGELGGVLLSGAAPLDRVELSTTEPLPLGGLGLLTVDAFFAWVSEPRHPYHPFITGLSLQWRPHPRFTLGVQRGLMSGGAPYRNLSFLEKLQDAFSPFQPEKFDEQGNLVFTGGNNVYSASLRWRLPTDAALPLTWSLELGTDDNPGAAVAWPGLVTGLSCPRLPRVPVSLAVEYVFFGKSGIGSKDQLSWYSHGGYFGGWAVNQTPLGDPLGGNGNALRASATWWEPASKVRVTLSAWSVRRFRDNLYGAVGGGRDPGVRGEVVVPVGRIEASIRGQYQFVNGGEAGSFLLALTRFL